MIHVHRIIPRSIQVSAMQPPSSSTPLIGIYFSSIMVIVAASTTVTIAILNFHHRGRACNSEMPPWVRSLFLQWLPWILRIERPGSQEQLSPRAFLMENKVSESRLSPNHSFTDRSV